MVKCHFDIAKRNKKEHSNTIQVMLHVEFRQKGLCGIVISSDVILQQYIGNDKVCFLFENTHSKVQIKFNMLHNCSTFLYSPIIDYCAFIRLICLIMYHVNSETKVVESVSATALIPQSLMEGQPTLCAHYCTFHCSLKIYLWRVITAFLTMLVWREIQSPASQKATNSYLLCLARHDTKQLFITQCSRSHLCSSVVLFPCMCWAYYRGIDLNRFGGIFVDALVC